MRAAREIIAAVGQAHGKFPVLIDSLGLVEGAVQSGVALLESRRQD